MGWASAGMANHVVGFGYEAFGRNLTAQMSNRTGPDWPGTLAIGWGMAFAYLLYFLKLRLSWWPFHPLGFAVSTSYSIGTLWLPMMFRPLPRPFRKSSTLLTVRL